MSEQSTNLSLPYIQAAQAQKHVTHNEAVELLDVIVQLTLEAIESTLPPANAAEGQAWAIGAGATGAWASYAGDIAAWRNGGWLFVTPKTGWRAYDKTTQKIYVYSALAWVAPPSEIPDLQNLDGVGINASADTTNRLSVSAAATLLNHEGAGHQVKVNKASATETASLLYQTDWSGRAEMGLAGNDDFSIKVSNDGATFIEALRVDASTGVVAMPATGQRQLFPFNYRYYMFTDRRWVGHSASSSTTNATTSLGTGAEPDVNWDCKGLFLPAGTTLRSFTLAGNADSSEVANIDFRAYFQHGTWGSWNSNGTTTRISLQSSNAISFAGAGQHLSVFPLNYVTTNDGYFIGAARPSATSNLTGSSYLQIMGALDVILPPLA